MNKKGIALSTALFVMIFLLLLGSIVLYIAMISSGISGSVKKYHAAFQAAESGMEEAIQLILEGDLTEKDRVYRIYKEDGKLKTNIEIILLYVKPLPGGTGPTFAPETSEFGRNSLVYRINAKAEGNGETLAYLTMLYMKVL